MTSDKDAAANALAAIRRTIERTAFRLAALPEDGRAQQLAIVRNAHEEALREHGHDPRRRSWENLRRFGHEGH